MERTSTVFSYILLVVLSIIWLYPIVWILLNAFRTEYNDQNQLIGIVVSNYFPHQFGLENFRKLFVDTLFPRWFLNTLFVSSITFVLSTFLNLSVAYVMSKIKFKARKPFLNIAIVLGLFPGFMSMIAIYYILKALGLTQTLFALILVYSAGAGLGFYVAKGFFDLIPNSLIESARLDGATNAQIFNKIILPMSKPIIIYTALLAFTGPWMDFIFARVILGETNTHLHTVAVGLYYMMYGEHIDSNVFTTFAAGCVCVAIPIVTLFIAMQKYYVEGVTAGAVKG
ncbi:MAG TPA: sugar ABC transporter permease [Bacillota bacterium]|nr:sugar ABC transporter permease [Bacillota bacterium]HPF42771.1 sugar ABC transporter permease [Bacillota bacterium]HPJ86081.1 sugar ABC transporter permease [Bacillota bacterium]HPQ62301.1 sugar ABC transporter permease [Bacillota bacterium]